MIVFCFLYYIYIGLNITTHQTILNRFDKFCPKSKFYNEELITVESDPFQNELLMLYKLFSNELNENQRECFIDAALSSQI